MFETFSDLCLTRDLRACKGCEVTTAGKNQAVETDRDNDHIADRYRNQK